MSDPFPSASLRVNARISTAAPGRSAVWIVMLREMTEQLSSLRFVLIALLVIGFTPVTVYVGARDYRNRLENANLAVAEVQALAAGPAGKAVDMRGDPWAKYGGLTVLRTVRRPEPMSVFVCGLDSMMPQYWDYSPSGAVPSPPAWQPLRLADILGRLDLEFLIRVVLGLLAILLAFDAVAGEKELGTLRTVLSYPVARGAVLTGKLLGGAATLAVALAGAMLAAVLSAEWFGVDLIAANSGRIGLLALAATAYLVSLYAVGLLVSSLARTQKTSLVVVLVVWVFTVLAVPPLADLIARTARPVTPDFVVQNGKTALGDDIRKTADRDISSEFQRLGGQYAYHDPAAKDAIDRSLGAILLDSLSRRRRLVDEMDREVDRQANSQNRLARVLMAISPAAAFANAAADLAGTGDSQHDAWFAAIERRQSGLNTRLFDDPPYIIASWDNAEGGGGSLNMKRHDPPSVADLPAFSPPRHDPSSAIQNSFLSLAQILLTMGAFIFAGFVAFSRYDVR
jgi:ABC-type transport system involved in multi-copper enzyme maturation permease subunit